MDVEQAFDYMNHIELDDANKGREVSTNVRLAALRDYTGKKAKARLNGVGETGEFRLGSAGRQGGVRTPDEWKNLLKKELATLAQEWHDRKVGFKMPKKGFRKEEGGEGEDYRVVSLEIFCG